MSRRALEWAGGSAPMPGYVMGEGEPFRPDVILWCEAPEGLVVRSDVVDPRNPVSFAQSLAAAMAKPIFGSPRRPSRVRVASRELAAELRAAHRELEVVVGPTPEVDEVLESLARSMSDREDESYLERGRIPEPAVRRLFKAAEILWTIAPWKTAADSQVLRVDVPELGVGGACLSIIGALGESFGFLLFPSLEGYEAFGAAATGTGKRLDLGTSFLSLGFERGASLPASLRREVARHGWPVAAPNAYPRVRRVDRDGMVAPLTEKDLRIAAAVATSLAAFFMKRGHAFEREEEREPICESWHDENGLEVRFTYPYEAFPFFDVAASASTPALSPRPGVGRNAPCPCGSGKKYKKCCLPKDEARPVDPRARCHQLDERLVVEMSRWARRRFGRSWGEVVGTLFAADEALQLAVPWSVYGLAVEGRPILDWFLEKPGRTLVPEERAWLEAQRRAWLGVWEVTAVEPGRGVTAVDLLSGEERRVEEVSGSKVMARRDTLLARVVDHDGISVFCGMHSRPLSPLDAAEVVERERSKLRLKRSVPVERLRDEKFARYLIERWEEVVAARDERRRAPPKLANTDGDPLLFTADHFAFDAADRAEVSRRLSEIDGVEPTDGTDHPEVLTFIGAGTGVLERPIIGEVRVLEAALKLETNSVRRADDLRRRIERACGALVRHRTREHTDPRSLLARGEPASPPRDDGIIPAEVKARFLREFKARHYAAWIDQPLPALDGETPRDAAGRKGSRGRVDALLKEMENHEARLPEAERFDFAAIRALLDLAP